MNVFIKLLACTGLSLMGRFAFAQTDTLYISTAQAEDLFIRQNLQLIAEKLSIGVAEAAIMQAKLWPNPTLSIQDVNPWPTEKQRNGEDEIIPPLFGSFARNTQFAVGVEQVIVMGGRRRKLVEMERVSRDIAVQYFEELLRSLKVELRNACIELSYMQEYRKTLEYQREKLELLINGYRNQVTQGNVPKSELLRLQASLLEVHSEINDLQKDMNQQQKDLNVLLCLPAPACIVVTATDLHTKAPEDLSFGKLIELADEFRPDLKEAMFQKDYAEKALRYEQSQRKPDLTLGAVYDRAGGVTPNFFGLGASMDLPFFNRNKGNIRSAQIGVRQNRLLAEQKQLEVHNEVVHAMQNYTLVYDFQRRITDEFIANLDEMLESYTRNFINKNIGIVELLDFFAAWKDNKRTMLAARKDVMISFEELQYAVGREINF